KEAANQGADQANDDVTDDAIASPFHGHAGQPTCEQSDHDPGNDAPWVEGEIRENQHIFLRFLSLDSTRLSYFLDMVSLRSLAASGPSFGCPITLTVKSPTAALSAALTVTLASLSPCLIVGLDGSMVTPSGSPSNFSVTSWSKFFPRLMLMVTS